MLSQSSALQQIGSQIGYKVRNIAHYGQPRIEIELLDCHGPRRAIPSYSTMDTIQGIATITAMHDTRFEDVDIAFVGEYTGAQSPHPRLGSIGSIHPDASLGTSEAFVNRMTTAPTVSGRSEARHRFLVLRQPIAETDFPSPRIFEAGRVYKFPFTFSIPQQLLPKACFHKVVSDHVRDMHCLLPPSLGDPDIAGFGSTLLDDLAPEMSKIVYSIKVKIAHVQPSEGISVLAERAKRVRVKPALAEQPPLNIDNSREYQPRQEKTIRKGLFKGKLGTLTARTVQPRPLVIPGARTTDNEPISTMSKVVLRFDPFEEDYSPPKMNSLATKIKVSTFYASTPRQNFPTRFTLGLDQSQGLFEEKVPLSDLCIASAQWEAHGPDSTPMAQDMVRRDSGVSDNAFTSDSERAFAAGVLPPSKDYKQGRFYTAQILVPITLPFNKNFIPTFHSCLISRTYTLSLKMAAQGLSLSLKVPVQVCAQGSEAGMRNARARSVEETVLRQISESSIPRSVSSFVTDVQRSGVMDGRDELPPDYAAWTSPSTRYRTSVSLVA